jgi:hypothetical protein
MAHVAVLSRRLARKPKPARADDPIRIASMIPASMVRKLDALALKLSEEDRYEKQYTRTDALKRVIVDGLKANGID